MDDDNFGPDFNDDFLDQPPEYDDFDDDDGAQFYLSTLNGQLNGQPTNQPDQDCQEEFANENQFDAAAAIESARKRQHSLDKPLGQHPLDWFINSEFNTENVKRKKLEISESKRRSLLDRIVAKKAEMNDDHLFVNTTNRPVKTSTYLQIRPTDGTPYYELTSPDSFNFGYIEILRPEQLTRPKRILPPPRLTITPSITNSLNNASSSAASRVPEAFKVKISEELWSEKYQPRSFIELLTENEHSTVVMTWLELWDQHVFKRKKNYKVHLSDYYKSMLETEELQPHLPKKKFLFLHGPSGTSKSTLAKICALQTGYNPVFIDASEYPNATKFKEAIHEYTGNSKINFKPGLNKPVCPIIENIDGATGDVINCLIKDFSHDKLPSRKKRHVGSVRRPIILISSNFFASSIRKLRQSCFAVHISALNKARTISRLEKICLLEGLDIKRHILAEMYEQSNNDLRKCLNNLQYLCSLWWKEISFSKEFNFRVSECSMFDVLNTILTTNSHYNGNKLLPPRQRAQFISNMLSRRPDVDTLYSAIFFNSNIVGKLRTVQRLKICKLLSDDDLVNSYMRRSQHWTLLRYTNTAAILIHFSLANYNSKRLTYNLGFMKFKDKIRECREVIETCLEAIKPIYRPSLCGLQLDLLPALYSVIQPNCNLTATQIQFCDLEETRVIHRIVEVMGFYGLTYSTSFDNLEVDLRLQPSIESVVIYRALAKEQSVGTLNTNAKKFTNQLLSRKHIENETMQQIENLVVSQEKKSQGTTELADDRERVPGLAFLQKGFQTNARDIVYITTTKLLYRQGSAQAIRIKVLNKNLFSFF